MIPSPAEGMAALEARDYAAAERIFQAIVAAHPGEHRGWIALAIVALHTGLPDVAVVRAQRAVALDPKNADYLNKLGVAYGENGELSACEQAFRRALKISPAHAATHHNLAKVLQKQARMAESLKEFERAFALDPASPSIRASLCGMHRLSGDPARALAVLRTRRESAEVEDPLIPHFADCIADLEGPAAALSWLRALTAARPASHAAHFNLAHLLLSLGHWREGWQHFRWRPGVPSDRVLALDARQVVLRAEYGLGDVLFFLRFVPELRNRGARVSLHLPGPLARLGPLLERDYDLAQDAQSSVWIGDLPSLLDMDTAPPALRLHPAGTPQRLSSLGAPPYLGLTWRAGTDLRSGPELGVEQKVLRKEVPARLFGEAVRGWPGTLISLQRNASPSELEAVRAAAGAPVHDLGALNDDLASMLAVLPQLDEYVAVSNTNIHLIAGVGRTARVLIPHPPEWRWMRRDGPSDWFPGFPVYRQPASMDWAEPLRRLREDLFPRAGSAPRARA